MATIGKIREKSGLVIILIGVAMLAFVATDLFSSRSMFSSNNQGPKGIGKIYGDEIPPQFFQQKYEMAKQNQKQQMGNAELSPFIEGQISDQIWNQMVASAILERESHELGLEVTGNEIMDLTLGPNPHPIAKQFFTNKDEYDRKQIYQFISTIDQNTDPRAQEAYKEYEDVITEQRLQEKYNALIKNGIFATDLEAVSQFENENKTINFQYAALFLNAIADDDVKIDDADYQKYYDAHKEEYKKPEGRTLQYVTFDVSPSKDDSLAAGKWISNQTESFKNTKNDSAFVTRLGNGRFSNQFEGRGSYPVAVEDQIFASDSGTIIGPYYENGSYYLVKVLGSKLDSQYHFHASHILIRPTGASEADSVSAYKKAVGIMEQIKGGADFAQMAEEHSQDPSNASKGGDLGWFGEGAMVKRFENSLKGKHKGDVFVVRTEFGTHIVKMTDEPSRKLVKAAILSRPVAPGKATEEAAYTAASKFRSQVNSMEDFDEMSKKMNLTKRIAENLGPNEHQIAGLDNPRDLIRWAYNLDTEVGSITDPRRIGSKYVVAILSNKSSEGFQDLKDVKDQIKPMVINEKKKIMLADRLAEAKKKYNSLEEIAKAVQSSVNTAEDVTFARSSVGTLANEPKLIGYAFGMKQDVISAPIIGETGSFITKVTKINTIAPPENMDGQRNALLQNESSVAASKALDALKENADVKDFRYLYY